MNTTLNLYYDFGSGRGGTIIDLAMAMNNDASIPAALQFIDRSMGGAIPQPAKQPASKQFPPEPNYEILSVGPLANPDLKRYLESRGIDHRRCSTDICEVHYSVNDQSYLAIGFASDRDGYELRNRTFKGGLGPKSISTRDGVAPVALVFEGFFDYLTHRTIRDRLGEHIIVLNSVSLRDQGIEHLRKTQISRVELFRDNDAAGEALLAHFREQLPAVEVIDQASEMYSKHKDLNEWHQVIRQSSQRNFL